MESRRDGSQGVTIGYSDDVLGRVLGERRVAVWKMRRDFGIGNWTESLMGGRGCGSE